MVVIVSGRVAVATLRAPSAQRPIRKSGRCSGEFFTRKGSSRSQTPLVIPQPEFHVKYLHNNSVRMVWPTVYDGQEVTIINLFYFYTNVHNYVSAIKTVFGYSFFVVLIVFAGICHEFNINAELVFLYYKFFTIFVKIETINKQMSIAGSLCFSCLSINTG